MSDLQSNYAGVFDGRLGFGRRPAVLVVDFIRAYPTPGAPLFAPGVVAAAAATVDLLAAARPRRVPIIYTKPCIIAAGRTVASSCKSCRSCVPY